MGIEQFHSVPRVYHFVEDGKFTLGFDQLEQIFNEKAREEGVTTEKQFIHVKNIDVDFSNRTLSLTTELYRLLEN